MGIAIVNEDILGLGAIGFLLWILIFCLILYSLIKRPKPVYSFDKKKTASIWPLVLALIFLLILAAYMGLIIYNIAVLRF
ncbi:MULTISPECIES: hypothetical protein [unclassified Enterococcus]|uniref:hypothetical protein n=1 Tax=unclassified Enterococcus TaxID=2608891 RepID=UPI0013EA5F8F|nr:MULTISPECIES: hypothetical protein [unclassified Enterococcus]